MRVRDPFPSWMKNYGLHHGLITFIVSIPRNETAVMAAWGYFVGEFRTHGDSFSNFDTKAWLDFLVPWVCAPLGRAFGIAVGLSL